MLQFMEAALFTKKPRWVCVWVGGGGGGAAAGEGACAASEAQTQLNCAVEAPHFRPLPHLTPPSCAAPLQAADRAQRAVALLSAGPPLCLFIAHGALGLQTAEISSEGRRSGPPARMDRKARADIGQLPEGAVAHAGPLELLLACCANKFGTADLQAWTAAWGW